MPVVLLAVAALILCGVVAVALGRGGELVEFASDRPPFDPDLATAADVAMLRPPSALWGYSVQATDEALNRIAQAVTERDIEIAALRRRLEELSQFQAPGHGTAGQVPASGWAQELRPAASSQPGEGLWPANPAAQGAPWPAGPAPGVAGGPGDDK